MPAFAQATLALQPFEFTSQSGETVKADRGVLTVPYDRSDPDSETIRLTFVRFPATTDTPGPPLVYLAGGPGGTGVGAAIGPRFELFMALRSLGDVIAWNQRGTGASEPRYQVSTGFSVPLEGPLELEWLKGKYAESGRLARAQFERDGFDAGPLNTNASADDLEDLRVALGAEKLRLWGISYGTHLALATVKRHPDSIESMVVAGVEGLDATCKLPSQVDAPIAALSREVAADPVLGTLIPDLTALMREVLERAEREPFAVSIKDPQTGETVVCQFGRIDLEMETWRLLFRRDLLTELPLMYLALSRGQTEGLAAAALRTRGYEGVGHAMAVAMDCASGVSPSRLRQIERETSDSLFGRTMNLFYLSVRETIGISDLGEEFRAPAQSQIPLLCLSGELDVRTPPSNAEEALRGFPNGRHVLITRAGHDNDLWVSSPQIAETILAFFRGEPLAAERIELPPIEFDAPESPALPGP